MFYHHCTLFRLPLLELSWLRLDLMSLSDPDGATLAEIAEAAPSLPRLELQKVSNNGCGTEARTLVAGEWNTCLVYRHTTKNRRGYYDHSGQRQRPICQLAYKSGID